MKTVRFHVDAMRRALRNLLTRGVVFAAIDFETATRDPTSACSVGLVRVEGARVVARQQRLIRPPTPEFTFTFLHGISWEAVEAAPTFGDVWSNLTSMLRGAAFLVAHYAKFDRRVLQAACRSARLAEPNVPFVCSREIARSVWSLSPARLPDVCRHLGIELRHHDAGSDAEACARIAIAAQRELA